MKQKLTAIMIALIAIISSDAQNVGIGTTTPLAQLSVGSASQFQVNSSGNLIRINNVPYTFPSVQGSANQILKNDGAGNLTWSAMSAAPKPVVRIFNLTGDFVSWIIDTPSDYVTGDNTNPTLTLYKGLTYQFSVFAGSFHPFRISSAPGTPSVPGPPFNFGVTNNDVFDGILTFTVPMDAPATLYYVCTNHSSMNGIIIIK